MTEVASEALSGQEVAHLRHELRTPVNQIVGYCEMLIEDAQEPAFAHRRQPLSEALTAVRSAISMIDAGLPPTATTIETESIRKLYESLHVPQTRIIDAMSGLLRNATGVADADFIADVCRIRDAAERLLPTDRPRAEDTSTFAVLLLSRFRQAPRSDRKQDVPRTFSSSMTSRKIAAFFSDDSTVRDTLSSVREAGSRH
jgi:His Kinase A (phosphoacceptor) domain.